jgi:SAM-dependent methyltransferase
MTDYLAANRANWEDRVPIHVASKFYDVEGWLQNRPGHRRAWERELLGDVDGLDVAHLQCHFGLDTLSLANTGARVTGLDFSGAAIAEARTLAERAGLADRARFVEANVLDAAQALRGEHYDLVYVSLGALCWLPSVGQWAAQVASILRPGGRLYLHDVHPLAWALAEDSLLIEHTYFEEPDPYAGDSDATYTDQTARLAHTQSYEWNHSISEIVTAVLNQGLQLTRLVEHDWTVWPRFSWLVATGDRRWRVPPDRPRVPLTFTLIATRGQGQPKGAEG